MDRENVANIVVLKHNNTNHNEAEIVGEVSGESSIESSNHLIVANTHILFNPKRGDIKLAQIKSMPWFPLLPLYPPPFSFPLSLLSYPPPLLLLLSSSPCFFRSF